MIKKLLYLLSTGEQKNVFVICYDVINGFN